LPFAVVAKTRRLQYRRRADARDGITQIFGRADERKLGDGHALARQELLLALAMLRRMEYVAARPHGRDLRGCLGAGKRDVLEFEGDHIDLGSEYADGVEVIIRSAHLRRPAIWPVGVS
jgi:hypothetical protein